MKKYVVSARKREAQLEANGWEFKSYEYEDAVQQEAAKYKNQGYDVKLLREQSDTAGLKMYSIWIKVTNPDVDQAIAKYLPKYQQLRLTELYKERDSDGTSYWWAMDPDPDDDIQEVVSGHSYSLQELKWDIDAYLEDHRRLGYDY